MKINIYGDSIMRGTVLTEQGRYKTVMGERIKEFQQAFGVSIDNRSRFGSTVEQGYERVCLDLEKGADCRYALVEFGGNDCNFHWDEVAQAPEGEHQPLTPLTRFESVYRALVARLRDHGVTPVLMTLPPIDAERYLAFIGRSNDSQRVLEWLGDAHMIYRFHELYSAAVAGIARECGAILLDVRSRFLSEHSFCRLIGEDGIHLNAEGYGYLAGLLAELGGRRLKALPSLA